MSSPITFIYRFGIGDYFHFAAKGCSSYSSVCASVDSLRHDDSIYISPVLAFLPLLIWSLSSPSTTCRSPRSLPVSLLSPSHETPLSEAEQQPSSPAAHYQHYRSRPRDLFHHTITFQPHYLSTPRQGRVQSSLIAVICRRTINFPCRSGRPAPGGRGQRYVSFSSTFFVAFFTLSEPKPVASTSHSGRLLPRSLVLILMLLLQSRQHDYRSSGAFGRQRQVGGHSKLLNGCLSSVSQRTPPPHPNRVPGAQCAVTTPPCALRKASSATRVSGRPPIDQAQLERELELDLENVRIEDNIDPNDVNLDEEELLAD
ncbi:hypothetical protein C7M84_024239 [Penaeus vannamei]|uniref:Uncharacterized protein n=1 Tax=Penaeus vannamei TaxID=6689 RepID=A0A423U1P8_PENVA|nr:hypothetical protein C7M84_024239 [Penaeus vannamei]